MSEKPEKREEIKVVKSPIPPGIEKLPPIRSIGIVTISIMLPNGILITNPEQFEDDRGEEIEAYTEE